MTLEEEFHQGCLEGYEAARKELGYRATYFLQMLQQHGGVTTAKLLLNSRDIPAGLMTLWHHNRLDMSLENYVLDPRFRTLFTEQELKTARKRLTDLDFKPKW